MPKSKKTTFDIPAGYQPPETAKEGETFDESCTLKLEGGKLCLTALNGVSVYDDKDSDDSTEPKMTAPPEDLASRYAAAMDKGAMPA